MGAGQPDGDVVDEPRLRELWREMLAIAAVLVLSRPLLTWLIPLPAFDAASTPTVGLLAMMVARIVAVPLAAGAVGARLVARRTSRRRITLGLPVVLSYLVPLVVGLLSFIPMLLTPTDELAAEVERQFGATGLPIPTPEELKVMAPLGFLAASVMFLPLTAGAAWLGGRIALALRRNQPA